MFKDLEIVDLQEPPAQMSSEDIRLPAFGLHNKRHADLIPLLLISLPSGQASLLRSDIRCGCSPGPTESSSSR